MSKISKEKSELKNLIFFDEVASKNIDKNTVNNSKTLTKGSSSLIFSLFADLQKSQI